MESTIRNDCALQEILRVIFVHKDFVVALLVRAKIAVLHWISCEWCTYKLERRRHVWREHVCVYVTDAILLSDVTPPSRMHMCSGINLNAYFLIVIILLFLIQLLRRYFIYLKYSSWFELLSSKFYLKIKCDTIIIMYANKCSPISHYKI